MTVMPSPTRIAFGAYVALFASTLFVTHSTPAWVRWGLVVALLAPIAAVLLLWPVLLVRTLSEVPAPDQTASEDGRETRIQVLNGGDSR